MKYLPSTTMTGSLLRILAYLLSITLFMVFIVHSESSYLKPSTRATTEELCENPCFIIGEEASVASESLERRRISELNAKVRGLKLKAELFKDFLQNKYLFSDSKARALEQIHWMNQEDMIISEAALSKPLDTLKSHYHLLSVYLLYIIQARTDGVIALKKSEADTRQYLQGIEDELYRCMCSIKTTIKSSGNDISCNVTRKMLNQNFLKSSSPLQHARYRTYITIHDGINLMNFLSTHYQVIEASIIEK